MNNLNLFFDVQKEKEDEDLTDYLIHCYLYYELNTPIIYDYDFDQLCKDLLAKWDSINHSYKKLVKVEDLKAGTGYSIKKYPKKIIEEAERRKEIFLQELKHEVEVAKELAENEVKFDFTNTPMETYLLCGMYRDFGLSKFAKNLEKKERIGEELKRRWDRQIHHEEFQQYFKDHGVSPEIFNLT